MNNDPFPNPNVQLSNPYHVQPSKVLPVESNIIISPSFVNECLEASHAGVVVAMWKYKRYDIRNEDEKILKRNEYARAASLIECFIISRLPDEKNASFAELASTIESVVAEFKDLKLKHCAAQMAANLETNQ